MLECFGAKADTIQAAHWWVGPSIDCSPASFQFALRGTYEPHQAHMHHTHTRHLPELPRKPHRIGLGFSGYSLTWYVDGRPTTSVTVPSPPFSSLALFAPIINLAMGGTLCQHVAPRDGSYEMILGRMALFEDPPGGWPAFGEARPSKPRRSVIEPDWAAGKPIRPRRLRRSGRRAGARGRTRPRSGGGDGTKRGDEWVSYVMIQCACPCLASR